jgi:endonuclease-3
VLSENKKRFTPCSRVSRYIKATTELLLAKHGGDVPNDAEALLALPGIGPKMGFIICNVAFGNDGG